MGAVINKLYNSYPVSLENADNPFNIDDIVNKALAKIYKERTGKNVTKDFFNYNFSRLSEAVDLGTAILTDNIVDREFVQQLKSNMGVFSAFKAHQESDALVALLTDAKGKIVPFSKFKKEALKVSKAYNVNYLETEYRTAIRRAHIGSQFKQFLATKDVYPNIRWLPSTSENIDKVHEQFYGLVLPIEHEFWTVHYPGVRWECKCGKERTKDPADEAPKNWQNIKVPEGLDGNPAFTHRVYSGKHPYFQGFDNVRIKAIKRQFEELKLQTPYAEKYDFEAENGGVIFIHSFADKADLKDNYEIAKTLLTEFRLEIKIRPHVENIKTGIGVLGRSNPEYLIDGIIGDRKRVFALSEIENTISKAKKQGNEIVVFVNKSNQSGKRLESAIKGGIKKQKISFKKMYLIDGGKVFEIK